MEVVKSLAAAGLFILLFSPQLKAEERVANLVKERPSKYVSVFSVPGENWKWCLKKTLKNGKEECINSRGWLDDDSKVWVVGNKIKAKTQDIFTGEDIIEEYYPVKIQYTRTGLDENGVPDTVRHDREKIYYVDAAYIEFGQTEPFYPEVKKVNDSERMCKLSKLPQRKVFEDLTCNAELKNLYDATKKIKEKVGKCTQKSDDKNKATNFYDSAILQKIKSARAPAVNNERDVPMTQEQLIAIDSLARTVYAEMGSCFKHGLQYPLAVARIAVNRAENKWRAKEFIKGPHDPIKPDVSKVVTSPSQFSLWLRQHDGKDNPALYRGMCPATSVGMKLPNGTHASPEEVAVWNQSILIATEAVMFPESFKKRTENLDKKYFYTSAMGQFYNMKRNTSAKVEGQSLGKTRCIEIWEEIKDREEGKSQKSKRKTASSKSSTETKSNAKVNSSHAKSNSKTNSTTKEKKRK